MADPRVYRTHRSTFKGHSEFSGETLPNTLPAVPSYARAAKPVVKPSSEMRLIYLTGTDNPVAPPDGGRSFNGLNAYPYSQIDLEDYRETGGRGAP